ncbi:hypothetical protein AMTR_s00010p00258360 [Amborella trichopoda]|uniref:Aminotransferase-like plant mobile domain-containing protein n=1 Tax=Amborella trichopoda TaxID=13333 RepID=W1NG22_AMBTC|nr:hypothetical protein AMTR_s00010p00258360 [Amborella trichopoda]
MTPTLFDVYEILGLAMDGDPITCRPISDLRKYIEDNLGIVLDGNLTVLRHTWLKANFRELPRDTTHVEVVRYTRAYLLFLVSVTIFAYASVSTVPTRYLQFFGDIEKAGKSACGATALACLYRSLEKACTFKRRHFSGLATLMQVIWNPYFKPDEIILDDRQQTFETAMCITTLIFDDIVEPYMSDRVRRQFGAKPASPRNPLSVGQCSLDIYNHASREARMENLQREYNDEGVPDKAGYDVVGESNRAAEDLAPSTQLAVEEPRRYNTRKK